jgi:hypothetical protein
MGLTSSHMASYSPWDEGYWSEVDQWSSQYLHIQNGTHSLEWPSSYHYGKKVRFFLIVFSMILVIRGDRICGSSQKHSGLMISNLEILLLYLYLIVLFFVRNCFWILDETCFPIFAVNHLLNVSIDLLHSPLIHLRNYLPSPSLASF